MIRESITDDKDNYLRDAYSQNILFEFMLCYTKYLHAMN